MHTCVRLRYIHSVRLKKPVPRLVKLILYFGLICLCGSMHLYGDTLEDPVLLLTSPNIIKDYKALVGDKSAIAIEDYRGETSRRDVVELILMQQALHYGGFNRKVVLGAETSYKRLFRRVSMGEAIAASSSVWKKDVNHNKHQFLVSDPLIREGEFVAGLFANADNKAVKLIQSKDDLKSFSAVSNPDWSTDWEIINALPFNKVHSAQTFFSMLKMVDRGRADILLANFPTTEDLVLSSRGITVLPVEGVKVVLHGERVWISSKEHSFGKPFFQALQKGLKVLRSRGTVSRAYIESGFFNPKVKNWLVLNKLEK